MKYFLTCSLFFLLTACSSTRQATKKQVTDFTELKKMVNEKNFDFVAERLLPATGIPSYITGFYDVRVNQDSLLVHLPYKGQAYMPPVDPSQSPLNFQSTSFDYSFTESNDKLNISIKPKDKQNVLQLLFVIFNNGSATLNINSSDRQSISFTGYISSSQ
ncbi:MAG: DUF4251 domain-containing protein [Bacteroidetes bacterium]|nr:DUF4251 domain-containing protein [Bacteroidota bacterium]